jgi:hypothetical protein
MTERTHFEFSIIKMLVIVYNDETYLCVMWPDVKHRSVHRWVLKITNNTGDGEETSLDPNPEESDIIYGIWDCLVHGNVGPA